jgi:hypothetical protein
VKREQQARLRPGHSQRADLLIERPAGEAGVVGKKEAYVSHRRPYNKHA